MPAYSTIVPLQHLTNKSLLGPFVRFMFVWASRITVAIVVTCICSCLRANINIPPPSLCSRLALPSPLCSFLLLRNLCAFLSPSQCALILTGYEPWCSLIPSII
ncbi:hypothetical protein SISNIDRAFT_260176 [Sistotremastrum niveocremeum HHB9708]|uniref:Uncharacterized protein n=1 Tax=Sistotremastrum niveocremeum HHB9708 TaxID=1314777 RepID=A0A164P9I5_9AGAM|nr:hypothetical protein SISNIDRAFT_260176 [Sistotremastrum niveocremeum HHB9708]